MSGYCLRHISATAFWKNILDGAISRSLPGLLDTGTTKAPKNCDLELKIILYSKCVPSPQTDIPVLSMTLIF